MLNRAESIRGHTQKCSARKNGRSRAERAESGGRRSDGAHLDGEVRQNARSYLVKVAQLSRLVHRNGRSFHPRLNHQRYLALTFFYVNNLNFHSVLFTADWLLILVHFIKYTRHGQETNSTDVTEEVPDVFKEFSLKDYHLDGLSFYLIAATTISYVTYFGVGGFLHWYYYVRQRDRAQEWKCQPNKWLSPELERHEIILGSVSLICGSLISGTLSCYIMNGGWSYIYYDFLEYGWLWAILQWPAIFIWQVHSSDKQDGDRERLICIDLRTT